MNSPKRIDYLDTVKAVGIFLVYIGHIAGDLWPLGIEKVFLPWKFIYSFHMPLFFSCQEFSLSLPKENSLKL